MRGVGGEGEGWGEKQGEEKKKGRWRRENMALEGKEGVL